MGKKLHSLLFKFAVIFAIFTLITLLLSGITTYVNQTASYREQCELNIKNIGEYLQELILADSEDFLIFQEYFLLHS